MICCLFLLKKEVITTNKNPIVQVKFSYVGKEADFSSFLKTIVRDYLRVDNPAAIPKPDFVDKVESGPGKDIPASY